VRTLLVQQLFKKSAPREGVPAP